MIVDDHRLLREGLKTIIVRNPGYDVIGEVGSGREALKMIKKLKPDLTLLDISLSDQSGIELIRHIQPASPQTQVMIISMHSKIDYIVKAFQALNLHSTIEIARYAAKLGIIDIDLWKE